jgi:hypothetical protein
LQLSSRMLGQKIDAPYLRPRIVGAIDDLAAGV